MTFGCVLVKIYGKLDESTKFGIISANFGGFEEILYIIMAIEYSRGLENF